MKGKTAKSVASFFLVLILTMAVIFGLSTLSRARGDSQESAIEKIVISQQAQADAASLTEQANYPEVDTFHSFIGFVLILSFIAVMFLVYRKRLAIRKASTARSRRH